MASLWLALPAVSRVNSTTDSTDQPHISDDKHFIPFRKTKAGQLLLRSGGVVGVTVNVEVAVNRALSQPT